MTGDSSQKPPRALGSPGQKLDRAAFRRDRASVEVLPAVLPETSVAVLAKEVISRLAARGAGAGSEHVMAANLADALTSRDDNAGMQLVMRSVAQGVACEDIYLKHLAGAARILGEKWSRDELASPQITIAAARIYAIMRGLSSHFTPNALPDGRHAVFATAPGEKHTIGITMATDLFRREGWLIDLKVGRTHDELLAELAETDCAILGLSATTPAALRGLIRLIAATRVSHPHIKIVVSGHLAETEPRLRALTDADYVSTKLDTLRVVMKDLYDSVAATPAAARG